MKITRNWHAIAQTAAGTLDAARPGSREVTLAEAAEAAGIKVPTLRTYLSAHRFLSSLSESLRTRAYFLPPIALETAARWYARDKAAAEEALRDYADGKYTVRTFATAERAGRPAYDDKGPRAGRQKSDYRNALRARLAFLQTVWPPGLSDGLWLYEEVETADLSGRADFLLTHRHGGAVVAAMIVGPYGEARLYRARARDWCLRLLGLTYFHEQVALLLPPDAPPAPFIKFFERLNGVAAYNLHMRDLPARRIDVSVQILRDPGASA